MPDPITDDGQDNAVTTHWYDDFAGEDEARQEQLSQFDSFDAFLDDYNAAKNVDWRDGIAGDDEKFKSTLERYATPGEFGNAHRELNQKVRSGSMLPEPPEPDDEAALKTYREQMGVPLEASEYLENLPEGLVLGEDDREIMADFMSVLHGHHVKPEVAHSVIAWYNDFEERQQEALSEMDTEQAREATDVLRDPEDGWGKDYRGNMNLIKGLLSNYFGTEASEQLMNGRYQDGRGFFNDTGVLMGLANLARKVNDVAPLIEQDPSQLKSLHDEISELEKYMKDERSKYLKDEPAQARLRELYDLRLRLETKDDAA